MPLDEYKRKRDFNRTPEPEAETRGKQQQNKAAAGGLPAEEISDRASEKNGRHNVATAAEGKKRTGSVKKRSLSNGKKTDHDRMSAGEKAPRRARRSGGSRKEIDKSRFVVQRHEARRLHYDLRLEVKGVLKSWAVPKGPSMNPEDKRLAIQTEDHPLGYLDFEGEIPKGQYGAGQMEIWDEGTFSVPSGEEDLEKAMEKGSLKIEFHGEKLKGKFALARMKDEDSWLLIKKKDEFAVNSSYKIEDYRTDRNHKREKMPGKLIGRIIPDELMKKSKSRFPHRVQPMLARLKSEPFDDDEWIYEIKWDGYRVIAGIKDGKAELFSRSGRRLSHKYQSIVQTLKNFKYQAVLDGELVVLDEDGYAVFQDLQNYNPEEHHDLCYYVFDLLHLEGRNLFDLPLVKRKKLLREVLGSHPNIRFSDHISGQGTAFFQELKKLNIEGMVAKKADSRYLPGKRSSAWLKVKTIMRHEAVVAGFTEGRGSRKYFGSLVLGAYENGKLRYIGHSGGGFDEQTMKQALKKMKPLVRKTPPFRDKVRTNSPVTWLRPQLVCEISFTGWTAEGSMRHPVFLGFRDDKEPKEVTLEKPVDGRSVDKKQESVTKSGDNDKGAESNPIAKDAEQKASARPANQKRNKSVDEVMSKKKMQGDNSGKRGDNRGQGRQNKKNQDPDGRAGDSKTGRHNSGENISGKQLAQSDKLFSGKPKNRKIDIDGHRLSLTNLDKIYWPEEQYTKGDLIAYYYDIAEFILPYLKDRPESLHRHPDGIQAGGFFHKDMGDMPPGWIEIKPIQSDSSGKKINYLLCQNKATLIYMANLGCIELNPWNSRVQDLDKPDYTVIDIDPDGNPFEQISRTALTVRQILDEAGLPGYCKTSGSSGLHVYIPLGAEYAYEDARDFARLIAQLTHERLPDLTSLERSPKKRKKKIYLDYLQNRRSQTLAAAYSVRPKPGATVSTPLTWEELEEGVHPSDFTIRNILKRLETTGDLFRPVLEQRVDIGKSLERMPV